MKCMTTLFAAGLVLSAGPASAALVTEDFDGDTNATVSLNLTSRDALNGNPSDVTHTVANDIYNISINGNDVSAAQFFDNSGGDFQLNVDVSTNTFEFSSGWVGLAARSSFPTPTNGIQLRVRNTGFGQPDSFVLELLSGNTVIDTSTVIDLTDGTAAGGGDSNATSFNLDLVGLEQANGDYLLAGTLSPDPSDNPTGLGVVTVSGTASSAAVPGGGNYGIFGFTPGSNIVDVDFDNFQAGVNQLIPEPSSLVLGAAGVALLLGRRCKQA